MLQIVQQLYAYIKHLDDKYADHRSDHYFILNSPLQMIGITLAYYIFVMHVGRKLMEKRAAYELKTVLLVYNMLQVAFNLFLALKMLYHLVFERPYANFVCLMPILNESYLGLLELHIGYWYFLLKIVDYLDTIFFILRKSYKQVNFLHVYHHIMVGVGGFIFMRYLPGGQMVGLAAINSWVHAVMYFYYFLSALRPELKKSMWWKKYITQMQLLQFGILILYFARPLLDSDCPYPTIAVTFALLQNVIMVVLFSNFYYKTYLRKPKSNIANGKTKDQTLKAE